MSRHIVVDPISRIEGQLRIEAILDDNNTITTAYSAGTMFRGIELILQGRDPRDAGLLGDADLRGVHRRALLDQHPRGRERVRRHR